MSGGINQIFNNVSFALHLHSKALAGLQEQASTGSRINRPSDMPSSAYCVLGLNSQRRSYENYIENISQTADSLEIALSVIDDMISSIAEVKVNLTQVSSGIYGTEGRERIAEKINDTLEQLVSMANTRHLNDYLFGGAKSDSAPYAIQRSDGKITSVTYQGSCDDRVVEVAPGVSSAVFYAGDNLFRSKQRQSPVFLGNTGAQPGSGTSSVRGDVWLTVTHNGTNYELSIDNGQTKVTVPDTGDRSNIAVTNAAREVLYVDATNITSTGVEPVRVPGTYDVFNTLINVRDILLNEKGLSEQQLQTLRNKAFESLEEVRSLLIEKSVSLGARAEFLEDIKQIVQALKYGTEDEAAVLQQADITQIAIDLSRRQILYEMSLAATSKLLSLSLLNFLK